jgi:putative nucleotidyltransferase with HDIG domain
MATSVFDAFAKLDQNSLDPHDFWMHSFGTARAAQSIGRILAGQATPENCFTGGLLHDMGKYVLALAYKDRYGQVLESARQTGCALDTVERAMLQTTHGEVGAWVARRWNFPDRLAEVVGQTANFRTYCGPFHKEVRIVAFADQLSCLAGFGCAGAAVPAAIDDALAARLGLSAQSVADVLQELHSARDDTDRLLGQLGEG